MIITVSFRNNTESKRLRDIAESSCKQFAMFQSDIVRVDVVFFVDNHHLKYDKKITCHISMQLTGKRHVNIYESGKTSKRSFHNCFERVEANLSKIKTPSYSRRNTHNSDLLMLLNLESSYENINPVQH